MRAAAPDAIVVGSGPNGLAAAITLARAGRSVVVYEGAATVGGGMRSAELTLPGYIHDVCSTVQGTSVASPFFARARPRQATGSSSSTRASHWPIHWTTVGSPSWSAPSRPRRPGWASTVRPIERLFGPLVRDADTDPAVHPWADAAHPAPPPGRGTLRARRRSGRRQPWRGVGFAMTRPARCSPGCSAHSMVALDRPVTASFGLVLAMTAHAYGWPVVRGGTQRLADALAAELRALGGEIVTGHPVTSLDELPAARAILFDTTPRALVSIAGSALKGGYRRRLAGFRYGPGVVKVDWALDGPIPWTAEGASRAGTVHVGGTSAEIAAAEAEVARGRHPRSTVRDRRAGKPLRLEPGAGGQAHRLGLRSRPQWLHARHLGPDRGPGRAVRTRLPRSHPGSFGPAAGRPRARNPNYVGGDINAGIEDVRQLFTRPLARLDPYSTPARGIYLCSSSTPPGGGVHGMCGVWAARSALRREFGPRR